MQDVLKPYMDDEEISAYLYILSPETFDELCRTQSGIRKKYETLKERERNGEVPRYKHVFVEPDWQICCPFCGSTDIIRKRQTIVTNIHRDENGNPVKLILHDARFYCKSCNKEFYGGIRPDWFAKGEYSLAYMEEAVMDMCDNDMTLVEAANKYDIPNTTLAEAFGRRAIAAKNAYLATIAPSEHLIMYPFHYLNKVACAIFGADNVPEVKKPKPKAQLKGKLYDIVDYCEAEKLIEFLKKHPFSDGSEPRCDWHGLNQKLFEQLDLVHKESERAVILANIRDVLEAQSEKERQLFFNEATDFITEQKRCLEAGIPVPKYIFNTKKTKPYHNQLQGMFAVTTVSDDVDQLPKKLEEWWKDMRRNDIADGWEEVENESSPCQAHFAITYTILSYYADYLKNTAKYRFSHQDAYGYFEDDDKLEEWIIFIKYLRSTNASLAAMWYRIAHSLEEESMHNRNNLTWKNIMRSDYTGEKLDDFYIDIEAINNYFDGKGEWPLVSF